MNPSAGLDDHSRTIVHIDIDCFYAQVEMVKAPELQSKPLGVQQKNIVVTSNYVAREYGVKKCMPVNEAKTLCPSLVLVNGEDLHDYREISYKVTTLLQRFGPTERLGLDENFVDVSGMVTERLSKTAADIVGNVFGDVDDICGCGCEERLKTGTVIAQEIRDMIKLKLNLTTCAGIGHNKLLAKLAGARHKPNQQTVVFPNSAVELLLSLGSISNIPSIGCSLSEQLNSIGIKTVGDLQNANISLLTTITTTDKAKTIHDLSYGIEYSPVKPSGKPQSIGIEDSCKTLSAEEEVRQKFRQLLQRLLVLLAEDGRIPKTIKVTVRKLIKNDTKSNSSRETRQSYINPSIFTTVDSNKLPQANFDKILTVIMRLFTKLVNTKKPYHLTLLGVAFTKFIEKPNPKGTLCKFFVKKDLEVQIMSNIENQTDSMSTSPSEESIVNSEESNSSSNTSESDIESATKRIKIIPRKRLLNESNICESPSKLKMSELKLNSKRDSNQNVRCPPNADEDVFWELPRELQKELWDEYSRGTEFNRPKKFKVGSILNYLVKQ